MIYPCLIRIIHVYPKHRWKLYDPRITLSISKYPCPEISIEPKIYPFIPKYPHLTRNIPLYYYYKIPMSILKYPPLFQNIPLYPEISPFIPKIPFYLKRLLFNSILINNEFTLIFFNYLKIMKFTLILKIFLIIE